MIDEKVLNLSLSEEDVAERIKKGLVNINEDAKTKSISRIIIDNTITFFNALNLFFMFLLIMVDAYKDMLFMGVVVSNTVIGIIQELRSKKAVDKLSIVISNKTKVVRNGEISRVESDEIVKDDIIVLSSGQQVPCDCVVISGFCYANEGLLTGESDLIEKRIDSELLSGSFVTSGEVYAKVKNIGIENYAAKIQQEAKVKKKINSEIMRNLNRIITYCSIAIFPIGIALFVNQFFFNHINFDDAVVSVVAALIGMIPEGLVLLTSTVLAVSVVRLSKKQVLVQQLFCIETLARVDVLCLDKTGTITTGEHEVVSVEYLNEDKSQTEIALKSLAKYSLDKNSTIKAIDKYFNCGSMRAKLIVPFASEKKWSGAYLENNKSYVLGAAESVYKDNPNQGLFDRIKTFDSKLRVVVLSESDSPFEDKGKLPENLHPIAIVLIKDKIRDNAAETMKFFTEQGVELKVISGDNNKTVENIAVSVGIRNAEKSVDATTLDTDEKLAEAADNYTVFGRVTPQQKKKLVIALKEKGHTVAMTGDGVNDVLALKESDCSIAVASGSDAAKNISQIVLIDDDFAHMPEVVDEGRRSINNIQRSASLFIVKTIYSIILAFAFIFTNYNYPFKPLHLSFINGLVIGIPSFILALQPNHSRLKGNFFKNVVMKAWPGGAMVVLNVFALLFFVKKIGFGEFSTLCVILTALVGVLTVVRLSIPIDILRGALIVFIAASLSVGIIFFGKFFNFSALTQFSLILLLIQGAITFVLYNVMYNISQKFNKE